MAETVRVKIVNQGAVGDADLDAGIEALQRQLDRDFWPEWGVRAELSALRPLAPCDGVFGLLLRPEASAGTAVRFEGTSTGLPLAEAFLGDLEPGQQWTHPASRELLQMLVDPVASRGAYGQGGVQPPPARRIYDHDITAACAGYGHGYDLGGWRVSDFVRRAWFGDCEPSRGFDHCGRIHRAFDVLDGERVLAYDLARDVWLEVRADGVAELPAPPGPRAARLFAAFAKPRLRTGHRVEGGGPPLWGGP